MSLFPSRFNPAEKLATLRKVQSTDEGVVVEEATSCHSESSLPLERELQEIDREIDEMKEQVTDIHDKMEVLRSVAAHARNRPELKVNLLLAHFLH